MEEEDNSKKTELREQTRKRVEALKGSFPMFLAMIWQHLNLPNVTPVQHDIAHTLQNGEKRLIIEAFRGVGKSFITASFVLWLLFNNPQVKVMVVSASAERADSFSRFVKRLIEEVPLLQHLRPRWGQRDSNASFDVGPATADQSPSVKSVGITGQLTGSRADIIVADDVEVPGNSGTQMQRDKLATLVSEFDAILKPLPTSRIVYLGTPQTEMSLYDTLQDRGYVAHIWPVQIPTLSKVGLKYGSRLGRIIKRMIDKGLPEGTPVEPVRFDPLEIQERRLSYGLAGFTLQFMLDTSLSDAEKYPLKLADMVVMDLHPSRLPPNVLHGKRDHIEELEAPGLSGDRFYNPEWADSERVEPEGIVMAIDPAGRGKDETGYAVVASLHGNLYLLAIGGFPGGYDEETLKGLAMIALTNQVNQIVVESNFGDGMFVSLLAPVLQKIHRCGIEEVRATGQKEARIIDTLEPVLMAHRLIVHRGAIEADWASSGALGQPQYSAFHQLTRITNERGALAHDDRLDALAWAVGHWVEAVERDNQKSLEAAREAARAAEIRHWLANAYFPSKGGSKAFSARGERGVPKGIPRRGQ